MRLDGEKVRLGLCFATLLALVAGFHAMIFEHLPGVFHAPEEDLTHGWIVPIFALYFVFLEKRTIKNSFDRPSIWGLAAAVPFLLLGLLGVRGLQVRFEVIAFAGLLFAVSWAMFGWKTAKIIVFPASYLLFCMPMSSYLSVVTSDLRLLVSSASSGFLPFFGMDVLRQGNLIEIPRAAVSGGESFIVDIADPCSGLRSIFALLAIAAAWAYFFQPTWKRKAFIFFMAIPCAIAGNICRIISICISAKFSGSSFSMLFVHDLAGLVVFFVATALLIGVSKLVDKILGPGVKPIDAEAAKPERVLEGNPGRWPVVAATFVLVVLSMAFQSVSPRPEIAAADKVALPGRVRAGLTVLPGIDVEPSVAETNLLIGAAISKKAYVHSVENAPAPIPWFNVSAVVSGPNKQSLHRPELCLPSQGFDMGRRWKISAKNGVEWRAMELKARGSRGAMLFAYTFFNQEGYRTSSHEMRILRDVWDRTVLNRVDRWTMITVQLLFADEGFLRQVLDEIGEAVR